MVERILLYCVNGDRRRPFLLRDGTMPLAFHSGGRRLMADVEQTLSELNIKAERARILGAVRSLGEVDWIVEVQATVVPERCWQGHFVQQHNDTQLLKLCENGKLFFVWNGEVL